MIPAEIFELGASSPHFPSFLPQTDSAAKIFLYVRQRLGTFHCRIISGKETD
ncbi:hypothetical protein B4135_3571 [Caldibacillus debilis]|uniref:Uncharacterized protein n=1 Tax=Caldibacillus debilis TaxID=301148 RepID=A0A150LEN6_9BACI|nr:hypothetical protein B4135_3571 [Caldibacillus debilis]